MKSKNLLLLIVIFFGLSFTVSAQMADTLFVSKFNDAQWVQAVPNNTKFRFLKFSDGSVIQIGEKMKIGKPSGTNQTKEQSVGLFSSSQQTMNNFSYLMLGRMGMAVMAGITYLPENFKGRDVEVEEIKFMKNGKKATNGGAVMFFNNPGMDITVLNLEAALEFGELINPKAAMTSDQALSELKRTKDKFDLGLITQEDFDNKKAELSKYIK